MPAGISRSRTKTARIWVTYNGEIYNHRDVRAHLEPAGHRYSTRSDTETIVHAYEEWGDDCVHRFRGMFAFGLWDAPRRRLLLVRDRLGVKPLYWAQAGDILLFASEIKSILASGLVEARPNTAVLSEVLATRYTSGTETLFEGIHKLLPGHRLVFEDGRVRVRAVLGPAARRTGSRARASGRPRARRSLPRAAPGVGSAPADGGRAARHVPLRAGSTAPPSRR